MNDWEKKERKGERNAYLVRLIDKLVDSVCILSIFFIIITFDRRLSFLDRWESRLFVFLGLFPPQKDHNKGERIDNKKNN